MGKSNDHKVVTYKWPLFKYGFPNIWRMSFLGKWQLANEFSVGKVNCDGNTLLSAKKEFKILFFFKKNNNLLVKELQTKYS